MGRVIWWAILIVKCLFGWCAAWSVVTLSDCAKARHDARANADPKRPNDDGWRLAHEHGTKPCYGPPNPMLKSDGTTPVLFSCTARIFLSGIQCFYLQNYGRFYAPILRSPYFLERIPIFVWWKSAVFNASRIFFFLSQFFKRSFENLNHSKSNGNF